MKFKVYKKEKEKEKVVYFKLEEDNDRITLVAMDEQGKRVNCGQILSISTKGLHLHRHVNRYIGVPLVKNGIIKRYKVGIMKE